MADARAIFVSLLGGAVGVTSIVGSRIYSGAAPVECDLPYLVLSRPSVLTHHHQAGDSGQESLVRVDIYGATLGSTVAVAEAVKAALEHAWGDVTVSDATVHVDSVLIESESDDNEEPPDGEHSPLWRIIQTYKVHHE